MCEKTYVFACGHKTKTYAVKFAGQRIIGKYCPQCFNYKQPITDLHCELTGVETVCEQCGVPVSKTGRSVTHTRYFLCSDCCYQKELAQHNRSRAKIKSMPRPKVAEIEISVTCPKCRITRKITSHEAFSTRKILWKYCENCEETARKYNDDDFVIYAGRGNDMVVNGKRTLA